MLVDNEDKIILDLCGGTGAFSNPYAKAGYNVKIITLPDYNVTEVSFYSDRIVFYYVGNYEKEYMLYEDITIYYSDIYGILAAPPCTEFSYAKSWNNSSRDMRAGMAIVKACMRIIEETIHGAWACNNVKSFKFWSLENPQRSYLDRFLGKPAMVFNPCDFGDPWTKKTALWGWFNEPKKTPVTPISNNFAHDKFLHVLPDGYRIPKGSNKRACRRAITPSGFANAFFMANR